VVVIGMRGVDSVESAADLKFSLSLAPLLGGGKGFLNAVLQSLSIFQLWYYVVFVMGIAAIFKMSRKAAVLAALPMWILSVLLLWLGGTFGGGMG
jgi:phosphoglycerol transferase MdoB-like AlkP superfamily enzyme